MGKRDLARASGEAAGALDVSACNASLPRGGSSIGLPVWAMRVDEVVYVEFVCVCVMYSGLGRWVVAHPSGRLSGYSIGARRD